MAILYANLSIDTTVRPDPQPDSGMTGHGYITTNIQQLHDRFGPPHQGLAPDLSSDLWVLDTPGGPAHLWAGTASDELDIPRQWLILAASYDVLPWVFKAVHGSTAAFPAGAIPHFTDATLHGFGNAYLAYLYQRMRAESKRPHRFDPTAPDFQTQHHRPQQINTMLNKVAKVLHDYEWAHADKAAREEWSQMQRPSPGEELRYWKARSRWLYDCFPHGGNFDLPAMLRTLADSARSDRDEFLKDLPWVDLVLHDEHEQTLRALAEIPIPGLDAIEFLRS